jgi:TonB family protein
MMQLPGGDDVSLSEGSPAPRLAMEKTPWLEQFASSLIVLVHEPGAPKKFLGDPFFRDCWIERRLPIAAFAAAVASQILLILFPPPIWNVRPPRVVAPPPEIELTWYGPVKDFPAMLPPRKTPKAAPPDKSKATPKPGADAYHTKQTIISEPLHPTHPRQTLIQPPAPPEPPKILPQLPNIVQLARDEPARPKLQLTPEQLAAMRPRTPAQRQTQDAAPEIPTAEKQIGEINILSSAKTPPKPALPVSQMSAPRAAQQRGDTNAAAPEIAQQTTGDSRTLIALSATPAPVAPPSIPAGNLSARVSISPEGPKPGSPGTNIEAGGSGHGPEGILISGGNSANAGTTSGLGIGSASRGPANLSSRPSPRIAIPPRDSNVPRGKSDSAQESPRLAEDEKVLGAKRIYTLHVNMPNLTSATGSWVLNFAELNELKTGGYQKPESSDVAAPVPLRKVDPKYPPELRTAHVEGEVILYAIIRKDGTVDSIQLVHGIDTHLDTNAMEALAQWKFQPAEKRGEPIDLEAVVHIPFRSRGPAF